MQCIVVFLHIFADFNGNLRFWFGAFLLGCLFFYAVLHVFTRISAVLCGDFEVFLPPPKWLFETAFFIFIEKNLPKMKSEMRVRFFVV